MEDLGLKLRLTREKFGISQRELARKVGVSNGTISQIEAGNSDPSFSLTLKILDGLGVTVTEFFEERENRAQKVFYKAADLVNVGTGRIKYLQLGASTSGRQLQLLKEIYPAGASTGPKALIHEGEEAGIVIKGRLEVQVGDQVRTLGPGEAYHFPSTIPHRFRNPGSEDCELVTACTPPF
ncbi:MAG: cupin domain-containing protein [Alphaproteobacteria bacterium]|nr:MAG: cupin domain-containing protein [Alphaproteobacteria bacterium]